MLTVPQISDEPAVQDAFSAGRATGNVSSTFSNHLIAGKKSKTGNRKLVAREYMEKALEMLSFDDCPEVCRAVSLDVVTRNCGQLWADSKGSEATYALSKVVTKIDAFISHNWIVGRYQKWVALSFRFNFGMAAGCTILANVLVTILTLAGSLPLVKNGDDVACIWNQLIAVPVFFFVLFFGRNILSNFAYASPKVFLDKVCIHQVSHSLQTKGIMKLGAFLACSEEMLILYTNIYLRKLWTVYEVAAFVILRPNAAECMKVVPVSLVPIILAAFSCAYLGTASGQMLILAELDYNYVSIIAAFFVVFYMYGLRAWHREKIQMQERVLGFKVRDCICAVESDRSVVYANIAALVKAFGLAAPTASPETALDAFDALVRRELPPAFRSAFGRCAFEYHHYVWIGYAMSGVWVFGHSAIVPFSPFPRKHVSGAVLNLHGVFVTAPLEFMLFELLSGTKLHLRGCKEAFWLISLMLAVWTPVAIHQYFMLWLMANSDESTMAYALSLAIGILSAIFGLIMLCRRPGRSQKDNQEEADGDDDAQAKGHKGNFMQIAPEPSANVSDSNLLMASSIPTQFQSVPPVSSPADVESDDEILDFYI